MSPPHRECRGHGTVAAKVPGDRGEWDGGFPYPSLLLSRHSSSTKAMRLSILADLHLEMTTEGNLKLVTSACKPTLEEQQSTEDTERSTPQFSFLWDLGKGGKEETEGQPLVGRRVM